MKCFELIVAITTLIANVVAVVTLIGAIVVYFKNRLKKERFPLIEARFGQSKHLNGFDQIDERDIYFCFYNKTGKTFYVSDCFMKYAEDKPALPIFEKERKNNDSIYDTKINIGVMPNAPCVIKGVLLTDRNFIVPKSAVLIVQFTNGKSFRYELDKCRLICQEDFV